MWHFKEQTPMKEISIFVIVFFMTSFISCNNSAQNNKNKEKQKNIESIDTLNQNENEKYSYKNYFDSLANVKIDTTTLEGKRERIMNNFIIEFMSSPDYDTLIDLTYDGHKDYVIGYYGKSGSGIKNGIDVFLFDSKLNSYILNEQLSELPNPTFYISDKKITGFYIGNGGGSGKKLEWINKKWVTTKEFEVDFDYDNREKTKWNITYPLKNKEEVLIRPFQMIPPEDILETHIKW